MAHSVRILCVFCLSSVAGFAPTAMRTTRTAVRVPSLPAAKLSPAVFMVAEPPTAEAAREPALAPDGEEATAAPVAAAAAAPAPESGLRETLTTGGLFALWYFFNIVNQIYNKKALNALPIPYFHAALQLFVGIPYCFLLWGSGLRKAPKLSLANVKTLVPVSLGHLGTHVGAVVSLGAGAVSFTHIVKASEPVVSALLSFLLLGAVSSWQTYATLLPIVGGVALASVKELSFTWLGFIAAMGSNLSSALRAIIAKKTMKDGNVGENMGPANMFGVLTILAFLACLPISLAIEPPAAIMSAIGAATAAGHSPAYLTKVSLLAGFFFYLYNEVGAATAHSPRARHCPAAFPAARAACRAARLRPGAKYPRRPHDRAPCLLAAASLSLFVAGGLPRAVARQPDDSRRRQHHEARRDLRRDRHRLQDAHLDPRRRRLGRRPLGHPLLLARQVQVGLSDLVRARVERPRPRGRRGARRANCAE